MSNGKKLTFDRQCQEAINLAKRAVPENGELNAELLLDALFHATDLKERFPAFREYLKEPRTVREDVPETVSVAGNLRPVLRELENLGRAVSAEDCLKALLDSENGRRLMKARGMSEDGLRTVMGEGRARQGWRGSAEQKEVLEALSAYGRVLTTTDLARSPLVGKEDTLHSVVRTLSRMRRRNVIILGMSGTGKSALVYELARRIREQDESIPRQLRDCDIFELIPTFLRSGASVVGQYEERIKALIQVLTKSVDANAKPPRSKVILFVDEIHAFFNSGVHARGPFSEANEAFKGVLAEGKITCMGCTTPSEYRHYMEPDQALARRFSTVTIEPPSPETTRLILRSRRKLMEEYYEPLKVPDPIIERVVELTEDHLPARYQPDKSIQLLDEACAHCATAAPPLPEVTEGSLNTALEDIIGHRVLQAAQVTEDSVYEHLRAKISGQEDVLRALTRAFVAGLGDWRKTGGPRGVFLFGGPTGVGKTETALLLSRLLGGGERENLVRVDCNTLQGSGYDSGPAINRLIGVPPGYIGYARGEGGLLGKVRDYPESVVLFDEFEKADPGVGKLLLQIIDDGRIEDVDKNVLDFRRSFVIFTTNAGVVYDTAHIGFAAADQAGSDVPLAEAAGLRDALRAHGMGEEFLGRIRHTFIFAALSRSAVMSIINSQLNVLRNQARQKQLELTWSNDVPDLVASRWQARFGARHIAGLLLHPLTEMLGVAAAEGDLEGVSTIRIDAVSSSVPEKPSAIALGRERSGDTLRITMS